jgi:hypothetical protein
MIEMIRFGGSTTKVIDVMRAMAQMYLTVVDIGIEDDVVSKAL